LMKDDKVYRAVEITDNRLLLAPDQESWKRLKTLFKGR